MLVKLLRFAAGFMAGMLLWWYGTPMYNEFLSRAAEPLVHIDSRLRPAHLFGGREVVVTGVPTGRIPADQLTYNVVLFLALFATIRKPSIKAFLICIAILALTHVLALVATIESTYATRIKEWSDAHYTPGEQDFWTAAEYIYRLAGMFGISFALWWASSHVVIPSVARDPGEGAVPAPDRSSRD
jgi:hypothetical protein